MWIWPGIQRLPQPLQFKLVKLIQIIINLTNLETFCLARVHWTDVMVAERWNRLCLLLYDHVQCAGVRAATDTWRTETMMTGVCSECQSQQWCVLIVRANQQEESMIGNCDLLPRGPVGGNLKQYSENQILGGGQRCRKVSQKVPPFHVSV